MIKHEIRWEYILVICIILGTLPCNAQSVIPMPKEMVMGEGSWDVSGSSSNLVVISFLFRWFSSSSFLIL